MCEGLHLQGNASPMGFYAVSLTIDGISPYHYGWKFIHWKLCLWISWIPTYMDTWNWQMIGVCQGASEYAVHKLRHFLGKPFTYCRIADTMPCSAAYLPIWAFFSAFKYALETFLIRYITRYYQWLLVGTLILTVSHVYVMCFRSTWWTDY